MWYTARNNLENECLNQWVLRVPYFQTKPHKPTILSGYKRYNIGCKSDIYIYIYRRSMNWIRVRYIYIILYRYGWWSWFSEWNTYDSPAQDMPSKLSSAQNVRIGIETVSIQWLSDPLMNGIIILWWTNIAMENTIWLFNVAMENHHFG